MTNEEIKETIVYIATTRTFTDSFGEEMGIDIEVAKGLADALIAAGIGDVSELKKHRVVIEKSLIPEDDNIYVLPNIPPTVKQLYSGEEVEQIVKEREEYKHRVEVAEKAFSNCIENFVKFQYEQKSIQLDNVFLDEVIKKCLQQAERELAEEGKDD